MAGIYKVTALRSAGTAADWTAANAVMQNGEIGIEIDTNKSKIGDGVTAWADLPYTGASSASVAATPAVTTVAGRTGDITLSATDVNGLATVATTGAFADLTGKPTLANVATTGAYSDLTGKPTLSTVAFSGSYGDLANKPALFSGAFADLTGKPTLATVATSGSYNDLTNKPAIPAAPVAASTSTAGVVKKMAAIADLTAAPTMEDFNGLLAALRAAGLM